MLAREGSSRRCPSETLPTAISPSFAAAWKSAGSPTCSTSRAKPRPTTRRCSWSVRNGRATAARPRRATARTLLAQATGARCRQERRGHGHLARGHAREDELPVSCAARTPRERRAAPRRAQSRRGPPRPLALVRVALQTVRLGKLRWRIEHDYRELKGWREAWSNMSLKRHISSWPTRPRPGSGSGRAWQRSCRRVRQRGTSSHSARRESQAPCAEWRASGTGVTYTEPEEDQLLYVFFTAAVAGPHRKTLYIRPS